MLRRDLVTIVLAFVSFGGELAYSSGQHRLDLSQHSLDDNRILRLTGDWEFYLYELLEPGHIDDNTPELAPIGKRWTSEKSDRYFDSEMYGTARLKIKLPKSPEPMSLMIPKIGYSSIVWLNGRVVSRAGIVGKTRSESYPYQKVTIVAIPQGIQEVELVVQMSSHFHRKLGISDPFFLGHSNDILKKFNSNLVYEALLVGFLLVMWLYHWMLYSHRRSAKAPLLAGLYFLTMFSR